MQSTRLASLVIAFVVGAHSLSAQQASTAAVGVTNPPMLSAGQVSTPSHRCNTFCTTAVGAFAGAAIGAGATYLYNENKPASDRSIADGPAVALMAIIGSVIGGVAGLTFGMRRD